MRNMLFKDFLGGGGGGEPGILYNNSHRLFPRKGYLQIINHEWNFGPQAPTAYTVQPNTHKPSTPPTFLLTSSKSSPRLERSSCIQGKFRLVSRMPRTRPHVRSRKIVRPSPPRSKCGTAGAPRQRPRTA